MQIRRTPQPLPTYPRRHREYRDDGVHVSQIIHDLCVTLDPKRFSGDAKDGGDEVVDLEESPKVWLGQAVDGYLKRLLKGQKVGSIQKDEVWMNCDLLSLVDEPVRPGLAGDNADDWIVEEFKVTWMSLRQPITDRKFVHWFWQLKAYCWAWETVRGRLRVFGVNGNYGPPTPDYQVYDIVFTYQELQDNWNMLLRHARKRGWL